jgi:hypothetical protein
VATYWAQADKKNWEVKKFEKSFHSGREKEVDTAIVADITELVVHSQVRKKTPGEILYKDGNNIIFLVSGDRDMIQAVHKVIDQEGVWKIEILGFEGTMAKEIQDLADKHPNIVRTKHLDPNKFAYIQMEHTRKKGQTELDRFDFGDMDIHTYGIVLEDSQVEKGALMLLQNEIPQWPFVYQKKISQNPDGTEKTDVMIVFCRPNGSDNPHSDPHDLIDRVLPTVKKVMRKKCKEVRTYASSGRAENSEIKIQNRFELPEEKSPDNWRLVQPRNRFYVTPFQTKSFRTNFYVVIMNKVQ